MLDTRTVTVLEQGRSVELVRATRPDGKHSYLLYVHGPAKKSPLVVVEQPYDGIDWTGEEVDQRWALQGDGLHPDVDAPGYNDTDVISYARKTPEQAAQDSAPHLINGNAVIHGYGRFYAGGSLEDDIVDATAAFHLALARASEIDLSRAAVFGGSWGGMMAIFGAARAPEGITLRSVVPLAPPTDFVELWSWTGDKGLAVYPNKAQFTAFYSPYRRRILAATGATPDQAPEAAWAPYRPGALCAGLRGPTLVLHDTWDVLVPCDQTRSLVAACPDHVQPFYWPRPLPIDYGQVGMDHGLFQKEPVISTVLTLALLRLHLPLATAAQPLFAVAHGEALRSTLTLLRQAQQRSEDVSFAAPVLRDLCDPRITAFDPSDGSQQPGAALLATELNAVWGTKLAAEQVCDTLQSSLPPP